MAETSDQIRDEIETTRARMGETVDALAYKADVPSRAKEWIGEKKDAVTSAVSGATPDTRRMRQSMRGVRHSAERNPIGLAIGGAAVGFLAGLVLPSTRMEDERLGEASDQLKSTAAETGREVLDRGKEVAQEAGQTALDTAKERGREESEHLSETLREKAQETVSSSEEPHQQGSQESPRPTYAGETFSDDVPTVSVTPRGGTTGGTTGGSTT